MASVTVRERVAAPPAEVFAIYADIGRAAERIDGIDRVEVLTPGRVGVGTRFRETRTMFGKEATEEMEFSAFEPPDGYTVRCESHGTLYVSRFDFVPVGDETEVRVHFDARPQSLFAKLMSPLAFLMTKTVRKAMTQDLSDLKRFVEGGGTPGGVAAEA